MAAPSYYPFLDEQKANATAPLDLNKTDDNLNPALPFEATIWHKPAFAHVEIQLERDAVVIADGGAMIWKDAHLLMTTEMFECWQAMWRKCAGESCCQNRYTGPGKVAFSFKLPGDISAFLCRNDQPWVLSAGAFICGSINIQVSTSFAGCYAATCGGEETWLTKVSCVKDDEGSVGVFYAGGYGAITQHEVLADYTLMISSGCFFATSEGTEFTLKMPGGCCSCQFGGEGLVLAIKGPAVVFTQNRNPALWKRILRREGPKSTKAGGVSDAMAYDGSEAVDTGLVDAIFDDE